MTGYRKLPYRPWTPDEEGFLKDNYAEMGKQGVAITLGRTPEAIGVRAFVLGARSKRSLAIDSIRHDYFLDVRTPEQAYILGLLAADGNVRERKETSFHPQVSITLKPEDRPVLEFTRDQIAPAFRLHRMGRYWTFAITSRQIADDLARFNIRPRKTYSYSWPDALPDALVPSFVHGYYDGDGCMVTRVPKPGHTPWPLIQITSNQQGFLCSLADVVERHTGVRFGGPYSHKDVWVVRTSANKAKRLDEWLQADGLGMRRKSWAYRQNGGDIGSSSEYRLEESKYSL